MESYTNKFSILLSEDKTEAVLNFYQLAPSWSEEDGHPNGGVIVQEVLPIASLVMTRQCVENFSKSLQELWNQDPKA